MTRRWVPFWYSRWQAHRNGRIDGRLEIEFDTLCKCCGEVGFPPYVIIWRDAGEQLVEEILRDWEDADKRLKQVLDEAQEKVPEARDRKAETEEAAEKAQALYDEVKDAVGARIGALKYILLFLFALAELGINYEPARALAPQLPDTLNLFFAFMISLAVMFLAERSGEKTKQSDRTWAIAFGGADALVLTIFGWYRQEVATANMREMVAQGQATGRFGASSSGLMLVSILVALLFALGSFVLGYLSAPSSPLYAERFRDLRQKAKDRVEASAFHSRLTNLIEQSKTSRQRLQATSFHLAQMHVNAVQMLAMAYLVSYNRAAPVGKRRSFPHPELPIAIPPKLVPDQDRAGTEGGQT